MRLAILDLGTNTFHLLIVDVNGKKVKNVFKSKTVVKRGERGINQNLIAKAPFKRGIDSLLNYKKIIDQYIPDKTYAFATSAIRSAENGNIFIKTAKRKIDIEIKIISGAKEAELIYFGVRRFLNLKGSPSLIMDIGGGSTEFIIADEKKIFWKRSFDIGVARMLEMFNPSNPISNEQLLQIQKFLRIELSPLKRAIKKFPVRKLIGSSGSFDTFAEMAVCRFHKEKSDKIIFPYKFNMDEFSKLYKLIIKSTVADRMKMKGLVRMRVDMIVIAGITIDFILNETGIKKMYLSKYALKEGALWEIINRLNK